MFNPGILKDNIKQLSIKKQDDNYIWEVDANLWSKAEYTGKRNIFSNLGYGEKQVKFLVRKRDLTLHNAFLWQNKHCFITDIVEIERGLYEVNTALIEPKQCSIKRSTDTPILDKLNRPIKGNENQIITFPACLSEKYVRQTEEHPISKVENICILTTPKMVELLNGELVSIQGVDYEILVSHTFDDYKNEYEIRVRNES